MNWLQPKLNLRVAQKQILTPGLVQMVSVLALNRLELREMINQEIMANPVLEEVAEENQTAESYTDEAFLKKETEKVPETEAPNPFDEFDFGSFFTQYLDTGAERVASSPLKFVVAPSGPYASSYHPEKFSTAAWTRSYLLRSSAQSHQGAAAGCDNHS